MRKQLLAKGEAKLKHQRPVVCTAANPCSSEAMSEFFHLSSSIDRMQCHLFESLFHPGSPHSTKYLAVGRVMILKIRGLENCAAVVLRNQPPATLASASASSSSSSSSSSSASSLAKAAYVAFVLVPPIQFVSEKYVASATKLGLTLGTTASSSPVAFNGKLSWLISEFNASNVVALLNEKLEVDVAGVLVDKYARKIDALAIDLLTKVQEKHGVPIPPAVWNQAVAEGLASPLPAPGPAVGKLKPPMPVPPKVLAVNRLSPALLLDPLQDLKLNAAAPSMSATGEERDNFQLLDEQYLKVQFMRQLEASPVAACPQSGQHLLELGRQALLASKVSSLRSLLSNQNLDLISDFETRMRILQHLQYVDAIDRTVQLKGRVACEINTCDSLIVTELIFENVLTRLEPEEIVSLLSCLIFQEKNSDPPVLSDRLLAAHAALTRITLSLGQLQLQLGLDIVPEDFVASSLNWGMMQVVWEWSRDKKFVEICAVTNVLEGSIVRCITRLDETCRDVRNAARVIGDAPLYAKMIRASELIKRSDTQQQRAAEDETLRPQTLSSLFARYFVSVCLAISCSPRACMCHEPGAASRCARSRHHLDPDPFTLREQSFQLLARLLMISARILRRAGEQFVFKLGLSLRKRRFDRSRASLQLESLKTTVAALYRVCERTAKWQSVKARREGCRLLQAGEGGQTSVALSLSISVDL